MVRRQLLWLLGLVVPQAVAQEWGRLTDQQLRLHLESVGEGTEGARAELLERKYSLRPAPPHTLERALWVCQSPCSLV
jgi:hypothetical protein